MHMATTPRCNYVSGQRYSQLNTSIVYDVSFFDGGTMALIRLVSEKIGCIFGMRCEWFCYCRIYCGLARVQRRKSHKIYSNYHDNNIR